MPRSAEELLQQVYARSASIRKRRLATRFGSGSASLAVLAGAIAILQAGSALLPPTGPQAPQARTPLVEPRTDIVAPRIERPCSCPATSASDRPPADKPRDRTPPADPKTYAIAFASDRDGDLDIYTMSADGEGIRKLTDDPRPERQPQWSPDGKRIAFIRHESLTGPYGEIYVMDANGSNVRHLATGGAPAWSPDGKRIAFHTLHLSAGQLHSSVWVIDVDGTRARQVAARAGDPTWTPDGRWILFGGFHEGVVNVYAIAVDGTGMRKISNDPLYACDPDVSPDGGSIAYTASVPTRVQVAAIDGSSVRRLTEGSAWEYSPTWSPDGTLIAFARDPDLGTLDQVRFGSYTGQPSRIVLARADGSSERTITGGAYSDVDPSFSPEHEP